MKNSLLSLGTVLTPQQLKLINGGFDFDHLEEDECDSHCHFYHNGLGYCYRC